MPELPEVETFRRYFERHALGQPIARVEVRDERILGAVRKESFLRKLRGKNFTTTRRHGKHLFAQAAERLWLHLHFGMSGDLAYYRDPSEEPRFTRVLFAFENGAFLAFDDMRIFGLADLVDDPDAFIAAQQLGRDPLDPAFRPRDFQALLSKRRGAVKSLLMAQDVVAGLGNLYVDEVLFQTGIHPRRPVDELQPAETRALFTTMRRIVRDVIQRHERGAEHPRGYLIPHREEGERCPRCGGTIRRAVVFGRTTYYCGTHQH
jgi:formamidopyrimidine-DNA glycosylase